MFIIFIAFFTFQGILNYYAATYLFKILEYYYDNFLSIHDSYIYIRPYKYRVPDN